MGDLKKQFDEIPEMDKLKRELMAHFQNYLRERQDFIASIPTMDPIWTAPLDIIGDIIEPILGSVKASKFPKCSRLFLLFDNIIRSENIRAGAIKFVVILKKASKEEPLKLEYGFEVDNSIYYSLQKFEKPPDFNAAIYLGIGGCQAFYGIIENILRNSARHSNKEEIKKVVNYSDKVINKQKPDNMTKPLQITIEFLYDYEGKKYKDDFIKVRIYDDFISWQKSGDKWIKNDSKKPLELDDINTLLAPRFEEKKDIDGRIIDNTGNVVKGSWGMKEMRICASFLRGLQIEDYENATRKPPIIQAFIQAAPKQNEKGSLGFEFFIPKVKDLLIISKSLRKNVGKNVRNELKNEGIYIEDSVTKIADLLKRGVFVHEFVAIDTDEEENTKYIKDSSISLPYKLFLISGKKGIKKTVIEKKELISWLSKGKSLKFKVNDKEYTCKSCYEKVMLEIYKKWIEYLLLPNTKLPNIGIFPVIEKGRYVLDYLKIDNTIDNTSEKNIFLLHRYDNYTEIKNPLAVIPFRNGVSAPETRIKKVLAEAIEGKRNDYQVWFSYFSLLEIGLTNVVIIDERVFNESSKTKNIFGTNINFGLNWFLQNVVILNLDKEGNEFILKGYKMNVNGELNQSFDEPEEIKLSNKKNGIDNLFPKSFENRVHFLIIHQNIISPKIGGKEEFKRFITKLPKKYKPWNVIVTSGRGHPPKNEMPENAKFLDFSNLRSCIIDNPNKFLFSKTLSGLKEKD